MKKLLYLLVLTFFISAAYAQNHDPRLLEGYTQTELDKMKADQPEQYSFIVAAINNGISIGPIPSEKQIKFDGVLDFDPNEEHTFLSLGIALKENEYQYFKFKGTEKMVVVLPKSLIKK